MPLANRRGNLDAALDLLLVGESAGMHAAEREQRHGRLARCVDRHGTFGKRLYLPVLLRSQSVFIGKQIVLCNSEILANVCNRIVARSRSFAPPSNRAGRYAGDSRKSLLRQIMLNEQRVNVFR